MSNCKRHISLVTNFMIRNLFQILETFTKKHGQRTVWFNGLFNTMEYYTAVKVW